MQEEFGCQAIFAFTTSKSATKDAGSRTVGSETGAPVGFTATPTLRLGLVAPKPRFGYNYKETVIER